MDDDFRKAALDYHRLPRPNERGAAAFAELCNLLHAQDAQLDELHAMLAELT